MWSTTHTTGFIIQYVFIMHVLADPAVRSQRRAHIDDSTDGQCDGTGTCSQDVKRQLKEDAFFNTYSSPVAQSEMVFDKARTTAYKEAMMENKKLFTNAIVVDVGCGTGILSLFAAKAGAKQVYCIEYTPIAATTRKIVAANGFEDIITVMQGKMEEIVLPIDSVDIIISEWMGYFGLFEGMYRSVLWARDRYLRVGGHMLPDRIALYVAAAAEEGPDLTRKNIARYKKKIYGFDFTPMVPLLQDWYRFEDGSKNAGWRLKFALGYVCDVCVFGTGTYPEIARIPKRHIVSSIARIADINMQTVTIADLDEVGSRSVVNINRKRNQAVDRIVGWFICDFARGEKKVVLDTSPMAPDTHWHQMVFHLHRPIPVSTSSEQQDGQKVKLDLDVILRTRGEYHREMNVHMSVGSSTSDIDAQVKSFTVVILPDTTNWAK